MPNNRPLPKNAKLVPPNATRVFKGEIFDVYQWPQTMYNGSTATFEMLKRADTVTVICVVDDKIIVLKQQQPDSEDEYWCFPGGRVDEGEDIYTAARREVLEETGIEFKNFKLVRADQYAYKIDAILYTFVATEPVGERSNQKLDGGEKITIHELNYAKVLELIKTEAHELGHITYLKQKLIEGKTDLQDVLNDPEIS